MDYMPLDEGYDLTYLYIAYVSLQALSWYPYSPPHSKQLVSLMLTPSKQNAKLAQTYPALK